jgi:hypothetical protein
MRVKLNEKQIELFNNKFAEINNAKQVLAIAQNTLFDMIKLISDEELPENVKSVIIEDGDLVVD